jgi:RimJ/RimL family protein N-acetyltransferase
MVTAKREDLPLLYEKIFSDEKVVEFTFGDTITLDEAKKFMEKKFNYDGLLGFSPIVEKATGKMIGYGGILKFKHYQKANQYEFGYVFEHLVWGLGYATEIALGQISTIKKEFLNGEILATVHPENGASKRVLEKVGMELIEESKELGNRGLRDIYALY